MASNFNSESYELKQGRFIVVPSSSGDKYSEVNAEFTEHTPQLLRGRPQGQG